MITEAMRTRFAPSDHLASDCICSMLNQLTLDRGPKTRIPDGCTYTDDNCWAAGNAGEMDFLEPGMSKGQATDEAVTSEYRASWSTLNNRMCARL